MTMQITRISGKPASCTYHPRSLLTIAQLHPSSLALCRHQSDQNLRYAGIWADNTRIFYFFECVRALSLTAITTHPHLLVLLEGLATKNTNTPQKAAVSAIVLEITRLQSLATPLIFLKYCQLLRNITFRHQCI